MIATLILVLGPGLLSAAESLPAPCVRSQGDGGYEEPASIAELKDCQSKTLRAFTRGLPDVGDDDLDRASAAQKAERKDYLLRHPGGQAPEAARRAAEPAAPKAAEGPRASGPSKSDEDDIAALGASLKEQSGKGEKGVTPQMAADIERMLQEKQGGATPEMKELLRVLVRDGGSLSDESMAKLKGAARAAEAQGVKDQVSPDLQKWLSDPSTDPRAGSAPGN